MVVSIGLLRDVVRVARASRVGQWRGQPDEYPVAEPGDQLELGAGQQATLGLLLLRRCQLGADLEWDSSQHTASARVINVRIRCSAPASVNGLIIAHRGLPEGNND